MIRRLQVYALRWSTLLVLAAVLGQAAQAAVEPQVLVSDVIARVMAKIDDPQFDDSEAMRLSIFEQELSPHLDFRTISQWLVRERWASSSESQRAELVEAVREHIVHVYATLLSQGRSAAIEVDPESTVRKRSARVGGHMATPDGRKVDIEFRLVRNADSWKLYDLVVAGVSFARSLQAELSPVIEEGGIEGLKTYLDARR